MSQTDFISDTLQTQAVCTIELDEAGRRELAEALARLARGRGLVVRIADLLGGTVALAGRAGLRRLGMTGGTRDKFAGLARVALERAYDVAILGLSRPAPQAQTGRAASFSRGAVMASGAASGFVGLAGFLPDATFTTLAIMREIARIAAAQGEDLAGDAGRRACLEVFALRGEADGDEESELGYFSARLLFQGRPMTMLLGEVASRYGLALGEKFSLQAVPVIGAVAGAALNAAFLDHYRNLALAHFTIRRLERTHGAGVVREARKEGLLF